MLKIALRNKGFSLVEMMVATSLSIITLAAISTIVADHFKRQNRLDAQAELNQLVEWSQKALETSPDICTAAVTGHTFDRNQAASSAGMPLDLSVTVGDATLRLGEDSELTDYNLRVKNLFLRNAQDTGLNPNPGENIFLANITGEFESTRNIGGNRDLGSHEIASVYVRVNGDIQGCLSTEGDTGDNMANLCLGIGGTWDPATRRCLAANDNEDLCTNRFGGQWLDQRCITQSSPQEMCGKLGFTWDGGSCFAAIHTITRTVTTVTGGGGGGGGGGGSGSCKAPGGTKVYREGSTRCEDDPEGGFGDLFLCVGGKWTRTSCCNC